MANQLKGEVTAEAMGASYRLVLDFNALCEFEDATGLDPGDTIDALAKGEKVKAKLTTIRQLIRAALLRHHPETTVRDAGDLITADPSVLRRCLQAAMARGDEPGGAEAPGDAGKPRANGD